MSSAKNVREKKEEVIVEVNLFSHNADGVGDGVVFVDLSLEGKGLGFHFSGFGSGSLLS
jgi:hypothetical protein